MLTTFLLASTLPLVQIDATDERLDEQRTFVSDKAELILTGEQDGDVLCLDRSRGAKNKSICLDRAEWSKAVTMAEAQPNLRNLGRIMSNGHRHGSYGSSSKYGFSGNSGGMGSRH